MHTLILLRAYLHWYLRSQTHANNSSSQVFRNLNSVTVPKFVGVPKNAEEDAKRGN